jgi:tetratricopeptide (TPR) repeat protein
MSRSVLRKIFLCSAILAASLQAAHAQNTPPQKTGNITITCATSLPISADGKPALDDALKSYRAEQYQSAIDTYKGLIAKNTDVAYAYAGLARVYLRQGNTAEAYSAAQSAAAAAPNSVPAQVILGQMYYRQGKLPESERAFLGACGHDAQALMGLARIYEVTANYARANDAIKSARQLAPDDPDVRWAWRYGSGNQARRPPRDLQFVSTPSASGPGGDEGGSVSATLTPSDSNEQPCRLVSKVSSAQVGMEMVVGDSPGRDGRAAGYLLAIKLDGVQAKLEIDTGSPGIVVSKKIGERAGIKPIEHKQIYGIGDKGGIDSYIGRVNSLKVGDVEFQNCYVTVSDRKLPTSGSDGLIGPIVFEDFLVDLNFPDAKFKLSPLPPIPESSGAKPSSETNRDGGLPDHNRYVALEMKTYTPVYRFGPDLLVPTTINSSPAELFSLDTGSFDDIISPSAAREVTHVASDSSVIVKGLSGTVNKVADADRLTIQFGHLKQYRTDTVTLDLSAISHELGTEVSGILGFGMLRMIDIKIDYRDALVDFAFNPNRIH